MTIRHAKRPRAPRKVWLGLDAKGKVVAMGETRGATAKIGKTQTVHGPYVLAERARER